MESDTLLFLSGMVLVRTETGQLVMVPQQVLAQAQAKLQQGQTVANITQRPATPTATTTIRVSTATTVGLQSEPERLEPLDSPESCKCAKKLKLLGQMFIIISLKPSFSGPFSFRVIRTLSRGPSVSQAAVLMPNLPTVVCVPGSSDCPPGLPLPDQDGSASLDQHSAGEIFLNHLFPLFLLEAGFKAPCWESISVHPSRLQVQISRRESGETTPALGSSPPCPPCLILAYFPESRVR